jgi:branched-chain amino acid transport system substrate-binding protein
LVIEDAGDSVERAKSAAQRVVSQHPDLVAGIGAFLSSWTLAITEVTERSKIPWVTSGWADSLTERGFRYLVNTAPLGGKVSTEALTRLVELAQKHTGRRPKTIGLIYDNTAYSLSFMKPLKAEGVLKSLGLQAVVDEVYTPGLSDATPLIQRVRSARPEFLWLNSASLSDAKLLIEKLTEFGMGRGRIPVLAPGSHFGAPEMAKLVGADKLEGMIHLAVNWDSAKRKDAMADLSRRAKEPWMNQETLSAYGGMFLIKDALERAKSTDKEKLMDALRSTDTKSGPADYFVGDGVRFDANGRIASNEVVMFQWQNGRPVTVYPQSAAYAPLVWPKAAP